MYVRDAVIIILGEQRGHGDNVLRIVVLDGMKIAKLSLSRCLVIDDILYHFLNVSFARSSSNGISNAVVFEVKLVVGFKDSFAVDVIAVHLVQDVGFAKEGNVVDDGRGGY